MPAENLAEEALAKNPNLDLAQWKFQLTTSVCGKDATIRDKLFNEIKAKNMAPFYKEVCKDLAWTLDTALLVEMETANAAKLADLQEKVADAEKNQGETEVRDALLAIAEHHSLIGDKAACLAALGKTMEKSTTLGNKLDVVFHEIRIGLFWMDHDLLGKKLAEANKLIEEGGDWDRRNRLRVYQGLYSMSVRDFKKAAKLFLDTVSTFTCYELTDYKTFVTYAVICCIIALPRVELRDKVMKGSEIQEVLHSSPEIKSYLASLYDCQYNEFFAKLAWMEGQLQTDRYLAPHYRYYVREMRIAAYAQLLESYRSLTLAYMAESFGVSVAFVDKELARFIAAGRLHAKIDKVNGIVETNRPDSKNYQYQACIKQGDILLNRIQKLSRVINI